VSPPESLFAEERRCPWCGAFLDHERRQQERREQLRRLNPFDDPGPPKDSERRQAERRIHRRRAAGGTA